MLTYPKKYTKSILKYEKLMTKGKEMFKIDENDNILNRN